MEPKLQAKIAGQNVTRSYTWKMLAVMTPIRFLSCIAHIFFYAKILKFLCEKVMQQLPSTDRKTDRILSGLLPEQSTPLEERGRLSLPLPKRTRSI